MVKNLWLMRNGYLDLDRSVTVSGIGYGEKLKSHVYSALIETDDKGLVLIDTGLNPDGIKDPMGTWGPRAKLLPPHFFESDDVLYKLNSLGYDAEDVNYVINTHMHWDHTGGHKYFKNATFVVQRAEYQFAYGPTSFLAGSYMKNHFDFDLNYLMIEGDYEFCEGINLIFTPGHTPGHMSVLVTMENSNRYILPGDAVYTTENIEKMLPPGNCWNSSEAFLSLNRLITLSKLLDAKIFPSHEENAFWPENGIRKL